jgi:hypothetical protein
LHSTLWTADVLLICNSLDHQSIHIHSSCVTIIINLNWKNKLLLSSITKVRITP